MLNNFVRFGSLILAGVGATIGLVFWSTAYKISSSFFDGSPHALVILCLSMVAALFIFAVYCRERVVKWSRQKKVRYYPAQSFLFFIFDHCRLPPFSKDSSSVGKKIAMFLLMIFLSWVSILEIPGTIFWTVKLLRRDRFFLQKS